MNTEHTQPTNEVIKRNEDPKEPPLLPIIHRRAGPSPPSGCDTPSKYNSCATGDVVSANPSRTDAAGDVISANPSHTADNPLNSCATGDVVSANPSRTDAAGDVVSANPSLSSSECNSCATGDVVSANPSRTDAAGDVVSANPSHTADPLSSTVCLPCNGADESLREAPNRILDWANLKTTIEKNLGNCKACKSPGLRLVQKNKVALCTEIAIICDRCDTQEKKLYQEIKYGLRLLQTMRKKSLKERKLYKQKHNEISHKQRKLKIIKDLHALNHTVDSKMNPKFNAEKIGGQHRTLDFDLNIRAMLSAFYLGTGGYDIGGMASFFGIPGGRGFERTFHTHSSTIHRVILDECTKILDEAMNEEIVATIHNKLKGSYSDADIKKYSNDFIQRKFDNLPDELKSVGIEVSYDMGWNKRSTGRVYDSLSGHAFMIGCQTGNVIDMGFSKKKCKICQKVNHTGLPIEHDCNINATGSSGAMESEVALRLTTALYEKWGGRVFICGIVSDDDSTMRAYLSHAENNAKGKLDDKIPEPRFMADPSHRIKVMSAPIFAMVTKTLDPNKCKMIDAMRVKKYVG